MGNTLRDELRAWLDAEGLMRYTLEGTEDGEVTEAACPPVVFLGPGDDDAVVPPDPASTGYPGKPLAQMTLDDFNTFLFAWFEVAAAFGAVRCANCGKPILVGDDLPDPETWDAIFVEKELVAWMLVHFDCKRWLAKRLKGRTPYDLAPGDPPLLNLSHVEVPETTTIEGENDAAPF